MFVAELVAISCVLSRLPPPQALMTTLRSSQPTVRVREAEVPFCTCLVDLLSHASEGDETSVGMELWFDHKVLPTMSVSLSRSTYCLELSAAPTVGCEDGDETYCGPLSHAVSVRLDFVT
jgi:hypothetical protein